MENVACYGCMKEFSEDLLIPRLIDGVGSLVCPFCGSSSIPRLMGPRPTLFNKIPLPVGTLLRIKDADLSTSSSHIVASMLEWSNQLARITRTSHNRAFTSCCLAYYICKDGGDWVWTKEMFKEIIYMPYRCD